MGLLDFLNTDEAQMGMGLLAAGGPTTDPNRSGFGQRIAGAMAQVQAQKMEQQKALLQQKYVQSQIDENNSQNQQRAAAMAMAQRKQDVLTQWANGGPSQGAPSQSGIGLIDGSQGAGVMPSSAIGGQGGQPQGGGDRWSPDNLARLKIGAGVDMTDIAKLARPEWQNVNGTLINTNAPGFKGGYVADPTKGVDFQGGRISLLPGSENLATLQGQSTQATEQAKGDNTIVKVWNPTTQGFDEMTQTQRTRQLNGGSPQGVQANRTGNPMVDAIMHTESNGNPNAVSPAGARGLMQVRPGTNTNPGFGITPARDNSEAERTRVGQEYIAKMQDRYKDPALAAIAYNWGPGNTDMWLKSGGDYSKLPAETKSYVSQVLTRNGVNGQGGGQQAPQAAQAQPQSVGFAAGPTAAQTAQNDAMKAGMVDTAKANVVRDTGDLKKAKSANQMIAASDRAIDLLKQGPTASGLGELADKSASFFGKSTQGAQISAKLDIVSGDIVNNVPRMEGPQSDGDRIEYKLQAGRAADRSLPVDIRLAAMGEVKRLQTQYASLNGGLSTNTNTPSQTDIPQKSSFKDFGYASKDEAIKDAQNAIMRNPGQRQEVIKRLSAAGLTLPSGATGSF